MRSLSTTFWPKEQRLIRWKASTACLFSTERHSPSLSKLKRKMTSRKLPTIKDCSSADPARLLRVTLPNDLWVPANPPLMMEPGHHLVYFPPCTKISSLLPDNTDPVHSPGPPFTRRMWAGGDITFKGNIILCSGNYNRLIQCREKITDVETKGNEGEEKVFVTIRRDIGYRTGKASIIENRRLVFMRDRPNAAVASTVLKDQRDPVKLQHQPDASQTFTPSAALLFRFSALTFNAHRIHLDLNYCRDVEGHRNLLVHGPLSLILMLQFLRVHLAIGGQTGPEESDIVSHIDYRCLAPLYAGENLKICVRKKDTREWETWIEGPDGGLAVRGTVRTAPPPEEGEKSLSEAKIPEDIPTDAVEVESSADETHQQETSPTP
ncbi:MAG: hypothetical protein LQ344_001668 [Seirophora lacunosa]|nr:MAG: hypothetical protein LQ344_001668 [Seirophora lacunosa]